MSVDRAIVARRACAGVLALALAGCPGAGPRPVAQPPATIAKQIEAFYDLSSGGRHHVTKIENRANLYVVTVQAEAAGAAPQEIYTTLDGATVFEGAFDLAKRRTQLQADLAFAKCLAEKGVRLFVDPASPDTRALFEQWGRSARQLAVDCGGDAGQACQRDGITRLPAIRMGERIEFGVHDRAWLVAFSGCR